MIRQVAAAALAILAAFLFWQGLNAVIFITRLGSSLSDALLQPPTSLWRLVATGLALLGGGLAAARLPGGAWAGMAGAVLFAALAALMAGMGTDSTLWMDEALFGAVMILLAGALVFVKRG